MIVRRIKQSKDPEITHVMHFDDGMHEKVGLPDPGIQLIAEDGVQHACCLCAKCCLHDMCGRPIPV